MEKNVFHASEDQEVNHNDSLFAEMVLDTALREFRMWQIQKEVDQTLRDRNKEEFLRLTEELKILIKSIEHMDDFAEKETP
ncbi:IDEAL domain-containing protein [Bacillus sp. V2I10]|uniref:IDEAL domain-containing protein n=1 Tax=Bacillus sp. V2I10 TaxID=3042276 RepID=UPI002788F277|nr:IDEAL domain-containing protein [Bacillus sp. V2I10]MDQ0862335.1 uncharacterized protein YpiB (UPF0302 family) [Bacillus sp. V2I10]